MIPASTWPLDKDSPVIGIQALGNYSGKVYSMPGSDLNPLRVSLQGRNTSSIEKNADGNGWVVFYVRDFTENGKTCPPDIYTIYVYQRGEPWDPSVGYGDAEFDLHTIREYKIALPVKHGSYWKKYIYVTTTGQKFKPKED